MKKKGYSLFSVILIIIITSVVSGITVGTILTKNSVLNVKTDNDKKLQEFIEIYEKLNKDYYEDVDSDKLVNGAIGGMLDTFNEPYTSLLNGETANDLRVELNGTYKGIGITTVDHEVLNTVAGSSAESKGIVNGDIIKSVNGVDVTLLSGEEVSKLIKESNDKVELVITRDAKDYKFNLEITTLDIPAITYHMIEGTNIGYLKISVFSKNVSNEIKTALETLKNGGMKSLIIDLRSNNGGYLNQSYKSASLFTKKGDLIYSLKNNNKETKYTDKDDVSENIPIVVLINKGTASAAEVLAGALKDTYGASLIGNTSYGKGKVQRTYTLKDGSMVKYTSHLWLRPNGECIDGKGITPDQVIDNEFMYDETIKDAKVVIGINDVQLETAKKLLSD